MSEDFEPRALVRSYTIEIAKKVSVSGPVATTLQQVVAEEVQSEPHVLNVRKGEKASSGSHGTAEIEQTTKDDMRQAARELDKTWRQFQNSLESKDAISNIPTPSFATLRNVLTDLETSWTKKSRSPLKERLIRHYRRCCKSIDGHKYMLDILPTGSEYFSVFTGVIITIVHATANYEKVGQVLIKALADIGEKVALLIGELYVKIFEFLKEAMAWFSQKTLKRVLKSLNDNVVGGFEENLDAISDVVEKMEDTARTDDYERLHRIEATMETTKEEHDQHFAQIIRRQEKTSLYEESTSTMQHRLVVNVDQLLLNAAKSQRMLEQFMRVSPQPVVQHVGSRLLAIAPDQHSDAQDDLVYAGEADVSPAFLSLDTVLDNSKSLEDFFDRAHIRFNLDTLNMRLPANATSRLREWILSEKSNILSFAGSDPYSATNEIGSLSLVAASMIEMADTTKVPVVSWFVRVKRSDYLRDRRNKYQEELRSMVYGFIRQLIEWFPPQIGTNIDLTKERFAELDGTIESLPRSLQVLQDCFSLAPKLLYCVIDGLHWLDDPACKDTLDMFVSILRSLTLNNDQPKTMMKVLFTSAGPSRCLLRSKIPRGKQLILDDLP
ncbi:hypothetical protein B9Z65_1861 [Elsinoe australis]|uniref:DUF7708 domain-containing protein n=1 Tax=Elsinoe australis TaxID=40998 RepID=A0A2P7YL27_9PEZI|nr:hypothetical protein B9Z65_1861 [Elsinoe australis]